MHEEHGFRWLDYVPGLNQLENHVAMAILVSVVLLVTTFVARGKLLRSMASPDGGLVPEPKLTYRNFFDLVAEGLYGLTETVIGPHDAPVFFPVIGCLFVFIFASNLIGLIPGFIPATDNLNTTFSLGVFVFFYYNIAGLRAHGISYLKHFLGPILWLAPLMLVIELVSHLFRPLSLALRLRGNILGDHIVLGAFSSLVPWLLPVVFYGLGLFVAFIQAFVFCLMTMVYISMSTAREH
jgi:F-type H+-transporting ATPase subunit a